MNSKFKKVSVSERLPEKEGWYFIIHHNPIRSKAKYTPAYKRFYGYSDIEFWLEEVPDHEEEMRDVLLQLIGCHTCGHKIPDWLNDKSEDILTKLKQD